jgi:hypothetical protein
MLSIYSNSRFFIGAAKSLKTDEKGTQISETAIQTSMTSRQVDQIRQVVVKQM